jgi:hypothetical protein
VNDQEHVYDFKIKSGKLVVRYHLDAQNGMMPKRIDYFQVAEPLFLFRFVKIQQYASQNGVFIPADATVYDLVHGNESKWTAEKRIHATQIETQVRLKPEDFDIQFPPGTKVQDHIVGIDYHVKDKATEYTDPDQSRRNDLVTVDDKTHTAATVATPAKTPPDLIRAIGGIPLNPAPTRRNTLPMWGLLALAALTVFFAAIYRVRRVHNH